MAVNPWHLVIIFQVVVAGATIPLILLPLLIRPRDKNPVRDLPYESGQVPVGEAHRRYVMQYYPYILMFVVFDVVGMFLFAWGLAFNSLGLFGSWTVILFILIIGGPLVYAVYLSGKRELW